MTDSFIRLNLPVGRVIKGNPYKSRVKLDNFGKPKLDKDGKEETEYFVMVAVPKTPGAAHWGSEVWGRPIWDFGNQVYPKIAEAPTFAWKIGDGDSPIPNKKGKPNNSLIGAPGHWLISLSRWGGLGPFKIVNHDGSAYLLDEGVVQAGDLVEIPLTIKSNAPSPSPGVYLNAEVIAFVGYSPLGRISQGVDPKSLGLGQSARPTTVAAPIGGASVSPAPLGANPHGLPAAPPGAPAAPAPLPPSLPGAPAPAVPAAPPAAPVAVAPAPSYLAAPPAHPAPPAAGPVRKMIGAAATFTYEAMIGQGWTDATLQANGLMVIG